MSVGFIAGITGVAIAIAGILFTIIFNLQFRKQLKLFYPDIHRKMFPNGSIGWTGGKDIEKLVYDLNDKKVIRLYKAANLTPAIVLIAFAMAVVLCILFSQQGKLFRFQPVSGGRSSKPLSRQ